MRPPRPPARVPTALAALAARVLAARIPAARIPAARIPAARIPAALTAAALLAVPALLAGCGAESASAGSTDGKLDVVASFYPLQYAVQQVGGEHVSVTNLTKPGVEPHDLELSPAELVTVAKAGLVVYESGLQPAVDEAVGQEAGSRTFDVAHAARLEEFAEHDDPGARAKEDDHSTTDPHFWLDPVRFADVAQAVADRLAAADPAHATDYRAGAADLVARLHTLDAEYRSGLKSCTVNELVTSHEAFGYLADAYGLEQVGISGISPDIEPQPAALAEMADLVSAEGVTTVYAETLASPAIAETVARETGAEVAVLDPIEGLTSADSTQDYFSLMRANLAAVRAGQECT